MLGCSSVDDNGAPLIIGRHALIRSHAVIYGGSQFGDRLETGHHVVVREGTRAGTNLRVGTQCDVQGDVMIGDYVRLHSSVFVSKLARIEDYVWLMPAVILTNDPHPPSADHHFRGVRIRRRAVIAAGATILPGIQIGEGAVVAAGSVVTRDVAAGRLAMGVPGKDVGPASEIVLRDASGPAYPWENHFDRDLPPTGGD